MIRKDVIECKSGWKSLYEPIINKIMEHDSNVTDPNKKIGIFQIKEKFGVLVFNLINTSNASDEILEMITNATRQSSRICEFCGTKENVGTTKNHWYKTCCKSCWEKNIKAHYEDSKWKELI